MIFSTQHRPNRLWDPPSLLLDEGHFPGGVERPGREADNSPSSGAEVVNGGAIPLLPFTFHGVVLDLHRYV
jgi:hypothetical protein